ncbi:MAG TPA: hypothetical protein VII92_13400 [Anaerolineae bacterium]
MGEARAALELAEGQPWPRAQPPVAVETVLWLVSVQQLVLRSAGPLEPV